MDYYLDLLALIEGRQLVPSAISHCLQVQLDPEAIPPTKTFHNDAGIDLYCMYDEIIEGKGFVDIHTGVRVKFPIGYFGRITGRSSTYRTWHLSVIEGICDEDYTGELFIGVLNLTNNTVKVPRGTRLAQLVLQATVDVNIVQVDELPKTQRGKQGFGSSGR